MPRTKTIQHVGSGTIVHHSGLVLTNWHLFRPQMFNKDSTGHEIKIPEHVWVVVGSGGYMGDGMVRWKYKARLMYSSGLDVAVLHLHQKLRLLELSTHPRMSNSYLYTEVDTCDVVEPMGLPYLRLEYGLAETMQAGIDQILVLGYPGNFLTVGKGFFWGLRFDRPESRTGKWILTGCPINCGNSGGAAVDSQGRLVGVPCQSRGMLSELRCIDEVIVKLKYAVIQLKQQRCPGFE